MTQAPNQSDSLISVFLAAAAKDQPPHAPVEEDVSDYDWNAPSRFIPEQMVNLEQFAAQVGKEISKALGRQFREEVLLHADAPGQYYAERLPVLAEEASNYCASLMTDGENCGLVAIPAERTMEWVAKVLGGSPPSGEERELSSLESALLQDILASATRAFSDVFEQAGGGRVQCGKEISTTPELPGTGPTDDYLLLSFRADDEDEQAAISLILNSELMAPAAGDSGGQKENQRSPDELRKDILTSLERANVTAEVMLGTIDLTMRGMMNLEKGDVLLINGKTEEPVELIVQGKPVLSGFPVCCEGQYALQVVDRTGANGVDGK